MKWYSEDTVLNGYSRWLKYFSGRLTQYFPPVLKKHDVYCYPDADLHCCLLSNAKQLLSLFNCFVKWSSCYMTLLLKTYTKNHDLWINTILWIPLVLATLFHFALKCLYFNTSTSRYQCFNNFLKEIMFFQYFQC